MIVVNIPERKEIFRKWCGLEPVNGKWSEKTLNGMQKERGVYVFYRKDGTILYVGKTAGKTMTFGTRLRRHFQKSASGGRHLWKRLKKEGPIRVSFIPEEMIWKFVSGAGERPARLSDATICLMEIALILIWEPEFQKNVWDANSN